ncbi:methyltransferase family protein [Christiangramia gaetbulicola]|uniref:Methyltransferase family protein n=1 Tax=Christiangramia gaetbulicola TaxID=703340 RepID=A0A2T6AJX6_9FLAO|nr:class I SAM-dependent methyltransferase [Christiangramia gaetbulicola]PTX44076.1 methyltransferase family protein [Christiangramia gaetbulicola]
MKRIFTKITSKLNIEKGYYLKGRKFLHDDHYLEVNHKSFLENRKRPFRTGIINHLLSLFHNQTNYLEIGVRNPDHNFNLIKADKKYSVDPGLEFKSNPVDFKMTSDYFFKKLSSGKILAPDIKFDVIFIDGLHLADQVDRDIKNSLNHIKDNGFIVLHDCNPPSEWHAREIHKYWHTPAKHYWNGTTWKAFYKWRCEPGVNSCCIDSDWGVGILSKNQPIGNCTKNSNPFFEFQIFDETRINSLNLIDFKEFKALKLYDKHS